MSEKDWVEWKIGFDIDREGLGTKTKKMATSSIPSWEKCEKNIDLLVLKVVVNTVKILKSNWIGDKVDLKSLYSGNKPVASLYTVAMVSYEM